MSKCSWSGREELEMASFLVSDKWKKNSVRKKKPHEIFREVTMWKLEYMNIS